jgi:hypothetical protein
VKNVGPINAGHVSHDVTWTFHPEKFGAGAEIRIFDVNGDGLNDVTVGDLRGLNKSATRTTISPSCVMTSWVIFPVKTPAM